MGKIKNIGRGTGKFGEGLIVEGNAANLDSTASDYSLVVSGGLKIEPGDNAGITFQKTESEVNFIRFANASDGTSYNATLTYQVAEHLFIQPGRGADFYIQARTNSGGDPFTFPFRIMDDGTAKFERRQSDSTISAGDIAGDIAFYVSGALDGADNALFGGNVVVSGTLDVRSDKLLAQGRIGIGTDVPASHLTINGTEPTILFQENGADSATIGVNSSDNILIENKVMNKHIVFKVNDQGVVKEGFRLDGAVPEVVVNQTSDSLVDFRVESDNQTHMLFVDGSSHKVGIGTASPSGTLHVYADISNSYAAIIDNDQGTAGHGLKVTSDASGTGGFLLDVESQSTTFFRARADQKVGIGNIASMPATLTVKGTSNSVPVVNIKNSADNVVFSINADGELVSLGSDSPSSNQVLTWDGSKAVWEDAAGGGGSGDNLSLTALKTSNYTAANWEMVLVNLVGASGDVTVTLPAASANKQIAVKIAGASMGKEVIVDGNGSETIDGLTTRILNTDYESMHLISDGNNWWRIS